MFSDSIVNLFPSTSILIPAAQSISWTVCTSSAADTQPYWSSLPGGSYEDAVLPLSELSSMSACILFSISGGPLFSKVADEEVWLSLVCSRMRKSEMREGSQTFLVQFPLWICRAKPSKVLFLEEQLEPFLLCQILNKLQISLSKSFTLFSIIQHWLWNPMESIWQKHCQTHGEHQSY